MNKEEYFSESKRLGLPKRCPILGRCERRILSIYFFSFYNEGFGGNVINILQRHGIIGEDFEAAKISIQGEEPTIIKGENLVDFNNFCPEIPLYDRNHTPVFIKDKIACTCGSWDNERKEKFIATETKHFSECAEYSLFANSEKKRNLKSRKSIPQKTRALLQKEINSKCPFCSNEDVGHFDVHHINGDTVDNSLSNLLLLCKICHSKITKKDISLEEVCSIKKQLFFSSLYDTQTKLTSADWTKELKEEVYNFVLKGLTRDIPIEKLTFEVNQDIKSLVACVVSKIVSTLSRETFLSMADYEREQYGKELMIECNTTLGLNLDKI